MGLCGPDVAMFEGRMAHAREGERVGHPECFATIVMLVHPPSIRTFARPYPNEYKQILIQYFMTLSSKCERAAKNVQTFHHSSTVRPSSQPSRPIVAIGASVIDFELRHQNQLVFT